MKTAKSKYSLFRGVLNVVRFLLGNSPASEFYMPTFRNALFHLNRRIGMKDSSYPSAYGDGKKKGFPKLDIHVSLHHDIIYENDQQDATV